MHDHNAILIGGKGPNEGNILVTGEGLIMGPLCDAYFGYDEVMHHYLTSVTRLARLQYVEVRTP